VLDASLVVVGWTLGTTQLPAMPLNGPVAICPDQFVDPAE
jgi:hypothetical protein